MSPEQFCYWLQGRAEMQPDTPPSEAEWKMIGEHLAAVFHKVTPSIDPSWTLPMPPTQPFKWPPVTGVMGSGGAMTYC